MVKQRFKRLITLLLAFTIIITNTQLIQAATIDNSQIPDGTVKFENGANTPIDIKFQSLPVTSTYLNMKFEMADGTYETIKSEHAIELNTSTLTMYALESDYMNHTDIMNDIAGLSSINDITYEYEKVSTNKDIISLTIPYSNSNNAYDDGSTVYFQSISGLLYKSSKYNSKKKEYYWAYEVTCENLDEILDSIGAIDDSKLYDIKTGKDLNGCKINNFSIATDQSIYSHNINFFSAENSYSNNYNYGNGLCKGQFEYSSKDLYIMKSSSGAYWGQISMKYDVASQKYKFYLNTDYLYSSDKTFDDTYANVNPQNEDEFLKTGDILNANTYYGLYNIKYDSYYDNDSDTIKKLDSNNLMQYYPGNMYISIIKNGKQDNHLLLGQYQCSYGNYMFDSDDKYKVEKIVYYNYPKYVDNNMVDLEIYLTDATEKIHFKNYITGEEISTIPLQQGEDIKVPDGYYYKWIDLKNKKTITADDILNVTSGNTFIGIPLSYNVPIYSSSIKDKSSKTGMKELYTIKASFNDENILFNISQETSGNGETYIKYDIPNIKYNITDISAHMNNGISPHYFKGETKPDTVEKYVLLDDGSNNGTKNDGIVDNEKGVNINSIYKDGKFVSTHMDYIFEIDNTSLIQPCTEKSYIQCNPFSTELKTSELDEQYLLENGYIKEYNSTPNAGEIDITPISNVDIIIDTEKIKEAVKNNDYDIIQYIIQINTSVAVIPYGATADTILELIKDDNVKEFRVYQDKEHTLLNFSQTMINFFKDAISPDTVYGINQVVLRYANNKPTKSSYTYFYGSTGFNYTLFKDELNVIDGHNFTNAIYKNVQIPDTQSDLDALINGAQNSNDFKNVQLENVLSIKKAECSKDDFLCTNPKAYKLDIELQCLHEHTKTLKQNVVNATCTHEGEFDEVVQCKSCDAILKTTHKTIPALGHTWDDSEWMLLEKKDITKDLFNNAENCKDLDYASLTDNKKVYKRLCHRAADAYEISITNHVHKEGTPVKENEVVPTCTDKGSYDLVTYCTECKEKLKTVHYETNELGHDLGDWYVVKKATYTEKGLERRICRRNGCNYYEERELDKLVKNNESSTPPASDFIPESTDNDASVNPNKDGSNASESTETDEEPDSNAFKFEPGGDSLPKIKTNVNEQPKQKPKKVSDNNIEKEAKNTTNKPNKKTKYVNPKTGDVNIFIYLFIFVVGILLIVHAKHRKNK